VLVTSTANLAQPVTEMAGMDAAGATPVAPLNFRSVEAYELSLYASGAGTRRRTSREELKLRQERERRAVDAQILEERRQSWEQMRAAVDEALARGKREAAAEMEQQMRRETEERVGAATAAQRKVLERAIAQVEQERARYFHAAEREVVRLALAIAARVLHRESGMDPLLLKGAVHAALEKLTDKSRLVLRVAPGDVKRWREHLEQSGGRTAIEIEPDAALAQNDCVLETTMGTVELGVKAQMEEIERGFFDLLEQNPAHIGLKARAELVEAGGGLAEGLDVAPEDASEVA
jgi:flagellar assembly protein FliH